MFVGGAPCQAFSMRGKRGGFEDTRGTLFREFARVVIECQPKVFIFENVKGMLNHDGGHTWEVIKKTFEDDCGYDVYYQVLNGKDYGIPQSRDRIYCIGFKKETDFKYPAPIELNKTIFDFLESTFDTKYLLKQKGVRFVTAHVNHIKSYTQINCNETLFSVNDFEEQYFMDKSNGNYAIRFKSESLAEMQRDKNIPVSSDYGRYRKLTPRECLRLMGFDDSFKIVVSDTATYKQSGNSIIVNVLMALLKQMDITKYGID